MNVKNSWFCLLWCAIVAGIGFVGCEGPADQGLSENGAGVPATSNLSGSVAIEGSSTVEPISNKAKEMFNERHPGVSVSVSGQGTGNGFKALAKAECDFSDASRPIKAKELKSCQDAGVQFIEIPVAYDGLTIMVNKENRFVNQLTIHQLKQIFREDSTATRWSDIDPSWPEEEIVIFAPGIASGTHDYFVEVIGKKDDKGMRSDSLITLSEDDKLLARGVKEDPYAIGFFGFAYYEADADNLNAVPIVNSQGDAVAPTRETIENGTYEPFSRPLFIYVNAESYRRLEVSEFVNFYLLNIADIVNAAQYVPLPQEIYTAAMENLENGRTGTHYLTPDGEKRSGGIRDVFQPDNLLPMQ